MQPSVEEMFAARDDGDREILRARPVEYCFERNDVVDFTVNHQRAGRNRFRGKAIDRRCYEHELRGIQLAGDARLHETAE